MSYYPDAWAILKISRPNSNEVIYKILAGWYGGYTGADEWRLNSGITSVKEDDTAFYFSGYSGSMYTCLKSLEKMNMMMRDTYAHFKDQAKRFSDTEIEEISSSNFMLEFNKNAGTN